MSISLDQLRITRGGYIDPWGTIMLVYKETQRGLFDNYASTFVDLNRAYLLWSPDLVKAAKLPDAAAQIVWMERSNQIIVENRNTHQTPVKTPPDSLQHVELTEVVVWENGYLFPTLFTKEEIRHYHRQLRAAKQGRRPRMTDNSLYYQVSANYVGQTFIHLKTETSENYVFDKTGHQIIIKYIGAPLAESHWDPDSPTAQYSPTKEEIAAAYPKYHNL